MRKRKQPVTRSEVAMLWQRDSQENGIMVGRRCGRFNTRGSYRTAGTLKGIGFPFEPALSLLVRRFSKYTKINNACNFSMLQRRLMINEKLRSNSRSFSLTIGCISSENSSRSNYASQGIRDC